MYEVLQCMSGNGLEGFGLFVAFNLRSHLQEIFKIFFVGKNI